MGTLFFVDVDVGAWVEQQSCLQPAVAEGLMMYVSWRSGRWSHGTSGVEESEDRIEDEIQDHVEFGDDTVLESEIEAIAGALEPTE